MTDSDEPGSDPGDNSCDYATVEEVAIELAALSASALGKIELQARTLVRGTGMDPGELINTVVERLLSRDGEHVRHWHRKEIFASCLYRTMKSIVRDRWRRQQIPIIVISEEAAGLRSDPTPEAQLIARQELLEVLRILGNADNTSAIAVALASGHSPDEVKQRFGLTQTDYDSALKRIRRRILRHKASGGRE
jgi:DNA-directed RNA polymerase specialized sigma24 family protein